MLQKLQKIFTFDSKKMAPIYFVYREPKIVYILEIIPPNYRLRQEIVKLFEKTSIKVQIPPIWCTTDNAAMICKVGEYLYRENIFAKLDVSVDPSWRIENYKKY